MSMASFTDPNRIPVLVADALISGPDDASSLATPDHPHGISNVFPPGSGFVPTRLARKTCIVNPGLAMAMVGSVVHMRAFREDALAHFRNQPECTGADVELFLRQYEADPDGSTVLESIDVFLLSSRPVGEGRHLYRLLTAGPNRRGGVEVKSKNLGDVLAMGSGAVGMKSAVDAVDTYAFGGVGPKEDWNNSHEAIARNLTLIARMHKVDELTGQMLLEYWGGGFEVIYRDTGNGLVYLKDYTILFLDPGPRRQELRDPPGGIHQVRAAGGLLGTDLPPSGCLRDEGNTRRRCSERERHDRKAGQGVLQFRHADERRVHGQGKTNHEHVPPLLQIQAG